MLSHELSGDAMFNVSNRVISRFKMALSAHNHPANINVAKLKPVRHTFSQSIRKTDC